MKDYQLHLIERIRRKLRDAREYEMPTEVRLQLELDFRVISLLDKWCFNAHIHTVLVSDSYPTAEEAYLRLHKLLRQVDVFPDGNSDTILWIILKKDQSGIYFEFIEDEWVKAVVARSR